MKYFKQQLLNLFSALFLVFPFVFLACSEVKFVGASSESQCTYANNLSQCLRNIEDPNSLDWVKEYDWGELNESFNDTTHQRVTEILAGWGYQIEVEASGDFAFLIRSSHPLQAQVLHADETYVISLSHAEVGSEFITTLVLDLESLTQLELRAQDPTVDWEMSFQVLGQEGEPWVLEDEYQHYLWRIEARESLAPGHGYWGEELDLLSGDILDLSSLSSEAQVQVVSSDYVEDLGDYSPLYHSSQDSLSRVEVPVSGEYIVVVENTSSVDLSILETTVDVQRGF